MTDEHGDDVTEEPQPNVLVVAAGTVTVLPTEPGEVYSDPINRPKDGKPSQPASPDATVPPHKRPDYTHPPAGRWLWALLAPLALAEIAALKLNVEWTLSRTVWWILGPAYEPRWWLIGMPLWALLAWTGPHFLWPHLFGGRELVAALVVGLAFALAGVALNR